MISHSKLEIRFRELLTIHCLPPMPLKIPEIWESIHKEYKGKWKEIANKQMNSCFSLSENELQNLCKKLTSSFDLENIEAMLPGTPQCAQCKNKGLKRCSRCKNEWYCGRSCQVSHWSKHQSACNLMAN
ncbi:zinc finger MYND domain-containing protein 10 [Caerostris extrusa]|uniref:Zinc finger MYND domain-containing protein 10 n=1 Tax=Caerostris extrusa TaxID=172846 RepID=A0AAV4UD48_CAEEX|nr:zinc finger MYND domain-containing protein 10 [Caerostris extrusa]